jgi:glycosyltransferase involved in cell wall biosynthesis
MLRVAHFIQRYPPALGGSEAYFARLSRYLAAGGDAVTVFTTTALDLEAFWAPRGRCLPGGVVCEEGVEIRRYDLWRCWGRRWLLKPLSLVPHSLWRCLTLPCNPIAWRMWHDVRRPRPAFDLVHAATFPYAFPIACALRLARRQRVPFLVTPFLHLGDPNDPRDRTRQVYTSPALLGLLRAADRVFVQTEGERAALLSHGLPEEKLVRLGMGVDPAECTGGDRQRARQAWGVGAGEVVIGHLANQSVEKGTVDLLRAAERAWKQGQHFHLVLAGPEMPSFRQFCETYGPRERVRQLGVLDPEQKRDFFAGLDAFALPSRSDSFGLVLLEAWANGLPNLAYRAGGVAEVVRHEVDGLLVRCGDVAALAAALGRLVKEPELRRRLGRAGQARTEHELRWDDRLRRVRAVYTEVVEHRGWASSSACDTPCAEARARRASDLPHSPITGLGSAGSAATA